MEIQGKKITEDDIGRRVTYIPNHAKDDPGQWERGVLSSFNDSNGGVWVRFKGPTGERCNTENLIWG